MAPAESYRSARRPRARPDAAASGYRDEILLDLLHRIGLKGWHFHLSSLAAIGLCITLWIRAKTVDQDERGNAERRALFVGLWPPTIWLIGDSLDRRRRLGS
jgi:hypothetical protein